jgi:hypothetical protein
VGTPGVVGIVWAFVIGDDPNSVVAWAVCAFVIGDDPNSVVAWAVCALVIADDPASAVSAVVSTLVIADDSRVGRLTREGGTDRSVRRDGAGPFALA